MRPTVAVSRGPYILQRMQGGAPVYRVGVFHFGSEFLAEQRKAPADAGNHRKVVELGEEDRPGHYRFMHDKVRETTYANITPERARVLHRRAAAALEACYGQTSLLPSLLMTIEFGWYGSRTGGRTASIDRTAAARIWVR